MIDNPIVEPPLRLFVQMIFPVSHLSLPHDARSGRHRSVVLHVVKLEMFNQLVDFVIRKVALEELGKILDYKLLVCLHLFKPDDGHIGMVFVSPSILDVVPVGSIKHQSIFKALNKLFQRALKY